MTRQLHLQDAKVTLGRHGLEEGMSVQYYHCVSRRWLDIRWDSPLRIEKPGISVMLRLKGVDKLEDWDIYRTIILGQ